MALKFANTPSDPDPPPYTRPVVLVGAKAGITVGLRSIVGGRRVAGAAVCSVDVLSIGGGDGWPRISRCLSSPSFSSSLSDPSASKVSARFWSTGTEGESLARCRDVGEEARERKDGGGEFGTTGLLGESSSFADTCRRWISIFAVSEKS